MVFHLKKLESPSTKDAFCQVWLKLAQCFWRRRLSMYFRYFVIISPWRKEGPFIWTNLTSHHPRMIWAKFDWNWHSVSGEEDLFNFVNVFSYFVIISPWYLNRIESPSSNNALCQVWLKLAQWFWRRR